jgi:hypothetical protein
LTQSGLFANEIPFSIPNLDPNDKSECLADPIANYTLSFECLADNIANYALSFVAPFALLIVVPHSPSLLADLSGFLMLISPSSLPS